MSTPYISSTISIISKVAIDFDDYHYSNLYVPTYENTENEINGQ